MSKYRDDRDGHIPQHRGLERWVDRGLGGNFQTIAANCEEYKSEHVQAFTWVINPNPDLIAFVPEKKREQFVRELTETALEQFFETRELDVPEYAYAIHRRETGDHRDNPHAHVILPGTYHSWADGSRLPLYMNRYKKENHIEMLHEAAQQQMDVLMQRYVGLDWEHRYDVQMLEKLSVDEMPKERTNESQSPIDLEFIVTAPKTIPDTTVLFDDGVQMQVWIGVEDDLFSNTQRVGLICHWNEADKGDDQAFISAVDYLDSEEAETLIAYLHNHMKPEFNPAELDALLQDSQRLAVQLEQMRTPDNSFRPSLDF